MRTIQLTHEQIDLLINSLFIAANEYQIQYKEICSKFNEEDKGKNKYWFDTGNKIYDLASEIQNGNFDV